MHRDELVGTFRIGLETGGVVEAARKLCEAKARIRELERVLGKKRMENAILHEGVKIGREKPSSCPPP